MRTKGRPSMGLGQNSIGAVFQKPENPFSDTFSGLLGSEEGGFLGNPIPRGVSKHPPLFKKRSEGGFQGCLSTHTHHLCDFFSGVVLLDCTSRVLSLLSTQPLLILSFQLGTPTIQG